jgi:hypothetical protein
LNKWECLFYFILSYFIFGPSAEKKIATNNNPTPPKANCKNQSKATHYTTQ